MKPLVAGIAADDIREARVFVDRDVVRAAEIRIDGIRSKACRRHSAREARQVEDLHAVCARCVRHDERVIRVDLDVAPDRRDRLGGQAPDDDRALGIADIDEGHAVVQAHQRVLFARRRVDPAPQVVTGTTAHFGQRYALAQ